MPTFNYTDGKTFTFDKFKPAAEFRIAVAQPPKSAGRYVHNINVYVSATVFEFERNYRRLYRVERNAKTIPFLDNMFPAVTSDLMAIGIPPGAYVPIKWNMYNNRFEIVLDGLENDELILEDSIADDETKKKVYGAKEEDEEEAEVPAIAK